MAAVGGGVFVATAYPAIDYASEEQPIPSYTAAEEYAEKAQQRGIDSRIAL